MRMKTVATNVASAIANSVRFSRASRRHRLTSSRLQAVSTNRPAIAAIGMCASKPALTAIRATSHAAAKTLASGVRAPPSKFGSERLSEPHET